SGLNPVAGLAARCHLSLLLRRMKIREIDTDIRFFFDGGRTGFIGCSFPLHDRSDLGAVQLYRVHDPVVRHGADAELDQKTRHPEQLMLREDFFDDFVDGANEDGPTARPIRLESSAREWRPS